jgi:hypothetical protein
MMGHEVPSHIQCRSHNQAVAEVTINFSSDAAGFFITTTHFDCRSSTVLNIDDYDNAIRY